MDNDGFMGKLNELFEWIMRFALINLLWFVFTLLGLVGLGLFPATTGAYAVARKWRMGEPDAPVFKTFWKSYRTEFIKANILGYILVIIGFLLYLDFRIIDHLEGFLSTLMMIVIFTVTFFFLFIVLFMFPLLVHYKMKTFQYIKNAAIISFGYPIHSIIMLVLVVILYQINASFPVIIPFFSISLIVVATMHVAYDAFYRIENRK